MIDGLRLAVPRLLSYRLLLLVAIVGFAALVPATGSVGSGRHQDYVGIITGEGGEDLKFRVKPGSKGARTQVRFEAMNIPLVCENNQFPEVDVRPIKLSFLSPTVFQGQRYRRTANGDWTYYEVKGRLVGPRRARGYIYYIADPFDPVGAENRPECSTGGQLYRPWKARRTR